MSLEYIRLSYGVPAKRGARVEFTGNLEKPHMRGTLVGARGQYVRVKMDGEKRFWTLHPTWELRYL